MGRVEAGRSLNLGRTRCWLAGWEPAPPGLTLAGDQDKQKFQGCPGRAGQGRTRERTWAAWTSPPLPQRSGPPRRAGQAMAAAAVLSQLRDREDVPHAGRGEAVGVRTLLSPRGAVRGGRASVLGQRGWQGRLAAGGVSQGIRAGKNSRDQGGLFECLGSWGARAWEAPISADSRIIQNDRGRERTNGRQNPESGRRGRADTGEPRIPRASLTEQPQVAGVSPAHGDGCSSHHLERSLLPSPPPELRLT